MSERLSPSDVEAKLACDETARMRAEARQRRRERILKLARDGDMTAKQIGASVGIGDERVREICRAAGIKLPRYA